MKYYAVIQYPGEWYFQYGIFDPNGPEEFVRRTMHQFGMRECGAGMGFGKRDYSTLPTSWERCEAIQEYLQLFPGFTVDIIEDEPFEDD